MIEYNVGMSGDYIESRRDAERDMVARPKKVIKKDPNFVSAISKYSKPMCPEKKERLEKINNRRYMNG
jgi:hypothetical protein